MLITFPDANGGKTFRENGANRVLPEPLRLNPDPERWDRRLLPVRVGDLLELMPEVVLHQRLTQSVTMAKTAIFMNNKETRCGACKVMTLLRRRGLIGNK